MNEGGISGRGNAANEIPIGDSTIDHGDASGGGVVFGSFDSAVEGGVAPGDDPLDELGRGAEGGWDLGGVEDPKATACSGTDVEKAATLFERSVDEVDGRFEFRFAGGEGPGDGSLVIDEEIDECGSVEFVEVG